VLFWNLLRDPLMGSCPIEVPHIVIEHALELLVMEDQQMVEAFLSDAPQEAFADRISSRGMIRCFQNLNGTGCRHTSKARPEFAIVITNQIPGREPIGSRFSQVLRHPGISGRACHAYVDHLARLQFNNEERKEGSKEEIGDLQEITGPDLCGVGVQKRAPLLTSWLVDANVPHVLLDSTLTHTKAQFQQFPRIRSAPQSRLSFAICLIKAMVWAATFGLRVGEGGERQGGPERFCPTSKARGEACKQ